MYLHIGNNYLLPKTDVIAIFNVPALEADAKGKKFLEQIQRSEKTVDVSDGKWVSVVLTDGAVYVSRISSSTLLGRSEEPLETLMERVGGGRRMNGEKDLFGLDEEGETAAGNLAGDSEEEMAPPEEEEREL